MAEDGATLYASLLKPDDFDPSRRYPVVVSVYGGPHAQQVTRSWPHVSPLERLLASRGFLVWQLDNRGSAARGKAFESAVFRGLGTARARRISFEASSTCAGLPYVDPDAHRDHRVLVRGLHDPLRPHPRPRRSSAPGSPAPRSPTGRYYDTIYTERYMGTPESNPDGYAASAPLTHAADLEGELLIIHGSSDDNVHLANTMAFVAELIKADRPHRLIVHPRQKHGFRPREDRIARDRAILDFFERTLK